MIGEEGRSGEEEINVKRILREKIEGVKGRGVDNGGEGEDHDVRVEERRSEEPQNVRRSES